MKPETHYIDTVVYLAEICEVIREGHTIVIPIKGSSMLPFLAEARDQVMLGPVSHELRPGDIVLYRRRNGQFILHRIVQKMGRVYYMKGDAQNRIEGPVFQEQILAEAVGFKRKGKWIDRNGIIVKFYSLAAKNKLVSECLMRFKKICVCLHMLKRKGRNT